MKEISIPALPPKVFFSYSHADRDFVRRLAVDLLRNRIVVWWDEWEIRVGDSLIEKIERGISGSGYLAVVLSPSSVNSVWVQEELKAAIARQLDEKKIIVLPILLSDCQIPLFLKEKRYADFRKDYSGGLTELLHAIKAPNIDSHGRSNTDQYHADYAIEWGMFGGLYGLKVAITCHSSELPYAVNCEIQVISTKPLSDRLHQYDEAGFPWATRTILLVQVEDIITKTKPIILIEGDTEAKQDYSLRDPKRGTGVDALVRARRLGTDLGSDIIFEWGHIFAGIAIKHREGITSALHQEELLLFEQWRRENPI